MKTGKDNKPHIGIYGRRNNGKSSLINRLANQRIAIVSDVAGTTTDPVKKSFEITGFGPVILVDTAGIDDVGELGELRVEKTMESIKTVDLAILVITKNNFGQPEVKLIEAFNKTDTPFFIIHNKEDDQELILENEGRISKATGAQICKFSNIASKSVDTVIDMIKKTVPEASFKTPSMFGDLLSYGDIVLLITPIDIEAPTGRLILPQVQAIRDVLDNDAVAIVLKEKEVDAFLKNTGIKPKLAITDSQIFLKADAMIPKDVPLTGFSVVLARMKGNFDAYLQGTPKISELQDGDRVLMLESCTHHSSCDDIGRVKIPRWITNFTGKKIEFDIVAGLSKIERPITDYSLIIQCGGCVITRKQLINRINPAIEKQIPVTNYGMAIAYVQGTYDRAIAPFVKVEETDYL